MRDIDLFESGLPVLRLLLLTGDSRAEHHDVPCALRYAVREQTLHTRRVLHELVEATPERQCNESVWSTPSRFDKL